MKLAVRRVHLLLLVFCVPAVLLLGPGIYYWCESPYDRGYRFGRLGMRPHNDPVYWTIDTDGRAKLVDDFARGWEDGVSEFNLDVEYSMADKISHLPIQRQLDIVGPSGAEKTSMPKTSP